MFRHTLVAAALALASAAHADVVRYDFGTSPQAAAVLSATTTVAHVQAGPLNTLSGLGLLCRYFNSDPDLWGCGGAINEVAAYKTLSFTVTADAGWLFDVNGLTFEGIGLGDIPPATFGVFSSLDGFTHPILEGDLQHQTLYQHYKYDTGWTAAGIRGPLEVRFSTFEGPSAVNAAWLLDNVTLDITVRPDTTVPEPGTLALGAAALLAAVRRGRSAPAGRRGSARPVHG